MGQGTICSPLPLLPSFLWLPGSSLKWICVWPSGYFRTMGTEINKRGGGGTVTSGPWGKSSAFPHLPLSSSLLSQRGKRTPGPSKLGQVRCWTQTLAFASGTEMPKGAGEERRSGEREQQCSPHLDSNPTTDVFQSCAIGQGTPLL